MDINSLMNSDAAPARRPSPTHAASAMSPVAQHHPGMQQPPRPSVPTPYSSRLSYGHPAPPSLDTRASSTSIHSQGTPVLTPASHHSATGSSYPFPSQYASPAQPLYRSHDQFPPIATPAVARRFAPPQQPSPSSYAPSALPGGNSMSAAHSIASPTLSLNHTPLSASSLSHAAYAPHPSQPSTPLGPPPLHARGSAYSQREIVSPYPAHQRSFSGTSVGGARSVASISPAPPSAAPHYRTASPAAYAPPVQQLQEKRRSTQYLPESDRERSTSVSPRTMVPIRLPSESRRSSQDAWSSRGSIPTAPQDQDPRSSYSERTPSALSYPPVTPLSATRPIADQGRNSSPLTQAQSYPRQLSHLLSCDPPPPAATSPSVVKSRQTETLLQQPLAPDVIMTGTNGSAITAAQQYIKPDVPIAVKQEQRAPTPPVQPIQAQAPQAPPAPQQQLPTQGTTMPLKRPAEFEPDVKPAPKKMKRKYDEPPVWARLAPSNPRFGNSPAQSLQPTTAHSQVKRSSPRVSARPSPGSSVKSQTPQFAPPVNGHAPGMANGNSHQPQELQSEKKTTSGILGMPWECSITDTVPKDEILTEIGNFLYLGMLAKAPEIGAGDARSGGLEIEAKIGTLVDRNTNDRLNLPVKSMVPLTEEYSKRLRFESFMTQEQHSAMNNFLNEATKESMAHQGRVRMKYLHRKERDSFATLSEAGLKALPPAMHRFIGKGHSVRLRTSYDTDPKTATNPPTTIARIVKVRVADFDLFSPHTAFDCRISINVELDLHGRADVDPLLLVVPREDEKEPQPDRLKDRMSYQHVAYSVDLTQVTHAGGEKTHELEVEVDAARLRLEAVKLRESKANAYEALVKGLLDNVTLLMRQERIG